MAYQVLARKWRPQTFQEVVGQEHVTRTLVNAIKENRVAQAYLFSGPRGVGKTTVARIFAKAINCEHGIPGTPCNKCPSCVQITEGTSVDVMEIDGASNRRIEEIRELRENINYLPSATKYRIYIIDEIHMLTKEAFNALLKTLEEPPEHAKFIFATTESHKVPLTILSRCQRFDFKRIPASLIVEQLKKITKAEGIKATDSALFIIARQSEGSMRDAQSLLDQVISFAGEKIDEKDVVNALGILDSSVVFDTVKAIIEGSSERGLRIVDEIYNHGYDIKVFYHLLMEQFRNLMISIIDPDILDMPEEEKEETCNQANMLGMEKTQFILDLLINKEHELMFTYNPRLLMEAIIVRLCNLGELLAFNDLIKKLEQIEKKWYALPFETHASTKQELVEDREQNKEKGEKGEKGGAVHTDKKDWQGFLDFVASKNKPMYNVIKGWELDGISGKEIKIIPDNVDFSRSYFKDKQRHELLNKYCNEYFGMELTPRLIISKRKSKKKKEGYSEAIQDVLNIFGGRIIEE